MRIAIVGAGAIGGWVGARLALAGHAVSVLARGDTLNAIRAGLRVTEGSITQTASVNASDRAAALGPQELVVIAVKAPALGEAAMAARELIAADTLIVPMMNGIPWWFLDGEPLSSVDPGGAIAATIPSQQLIGCVVHAACRRTRPGSIEVVLADRLILGEPAGGASKRVGQLCRLLDEAGLTATPSHNIRRDIWYKLWGNMTINPVSALTLATADRILASAELRPFILACMAEAAQVGSAIDCPISESGEDRMAVTARLGAFKTSMLQDVEAGRPIELEALIGAPREIARRVGIATPNMDALYALTRLMATSRGLG